MTTLSMEKDQWKSYGLRIFLNTLSHPFEYAKVLIQIGHEPIPPVYTKTFFGKPAMSLPNIFQYVKYIYSVDGLVGCYRGLTPKLCGSLVSAIATQKMVTYFHLNKETEIDEEDEESSEEGNKYFLQCIKSDILTHTMAIITSNSFNVISIRMMGQFVGRETRYDGLFASMKEIYSQSGFMGFFAGVVPRLLGDILTILLATSLTHLVNRHFLKDKEIKNYSSLIISLFSCSIMYPFQVVSSCMAINNSGLAAGSPPYMPVYNNWLDCWQDLSKHNQLKRGSSLLIRYYVPSSVKSK